MREHGCFWCQGNFWLYLKELHLILKNGISDARKDGFSVSDYKKLPNEVGDIDTALLEEIADKMKALLKEYNAKEEKTFEDILDFHVKFEKVHPFRDDNGRVGFPTLHSLESGLWFMSTAILAFPVLPGVSLKTLSTVIFALPVLPGPNL